LDLFSNALFSCHHKILDWSHLPCQSESFL
jgi:hypothetical protein